MSALAPHIGPNAAALHNFGFRALTTNLRDPEQRTVEVDGHTAAIRQCLEG
jgi:hypothetical protein